jgi:hypothetical protein
MITSSAGRAILMFGVVAIVSGCGPDGPSRYSISGSVTFQGKPVPVGFIKFEPDTTKGNAGPGTGAPIKDGNYNVPSAKGILGGHYRVIVDGFDGIPAVVDGEKSPDGKLLFSNQQVPAELPQQDTTWNIELPSSSKSMK